MNTSIDPTQAVPRARYLLITALALNGAVCLCLLVLFSNYRSSIDVVFTVDIARVEAALYAKPPEEGRQSSIQLLLKANKSLRTTVNLVQRGFYCVVSLLFANIILTALGVSTLRRRHVSVRHPREHGLPQ